MEQNAFAGRTAPPTEPDLADALGGRARTRWERFIEGMVERVGATTSCWSSYSPKAGWSLKVQRKQRTIVYMIPHGGSFGVAFALGEKARQAALRFELPKAVQVALTAAPRYAEGYAVRFEVRNLRDLQAALLVASAKVDA